MHLLLDRNGLEQWFPTGGPRRSKGGPQRPKGGPRTILILGDGEALVIMQSVRRTCYMGSSRVCFGVKYKLFRHTYLLKYFKIITLIHRFYELSMPVNVRKL